jgi:DNA mismatch repair protein MutS
MSELLNQYKELKEKYPEAVLLFRVGDCYEAYEEDAKTAANILDGLFFETNEGKEEKAAFSIPYSGLDMALQKLVRAGNKVAVCDQLEDPQTTRGLTKRGVTDLLK